MPETKPPPLDIQRPRPLLDLGRHDAVPGLPKEAQRICAGAVGVLTGGDKEPRVVCTQCWSDLGGFPVFAQIQGELSAAHKEWMAANRRGK
jgi:hypothetical protein